MKYMQPCSVLRMSIPMTEVKFLREVFSARVLGPWAMSGANVNESHPARGFKLSPPFGFKGSLADRISEGTQTTVRIGLDTACV